MSVKNVDPASTKNHGMQKSGNIRTDYGKDGSFKVGSAAQERRNDGGFGGGDSDLSHSISGGKAKQTWSD